MLCSSTGSVTHLLCCGCYANNSRDDDAGNCGKVVTRTGIDNRNVMVTKSKIKKQFQNTS